LVLVRHFFDRVTLMNIGFYDPISERWIKPRPEKTVEPVDPVSLGEALLNAVAATAEKERCDRIWKITRQVAEGVNAPTASPVQPASEHDAASLQWDDRPIAEQMAEIFEGNAAPIAIDPPPDYEPEFSLGYIYWKPKD
jgi:hypothetical protein